MPLLADTSNPSPRWTIAIAIAITLLAAALRVQPLAESLWVDELHTAWCAVGPLTEVASRAAIGNQSPIYFWLQWMLATILGPSEFTLRLPSFAAGSLLPLASFLIARRCGVGGAGLVAAALIAIDPQSIFYATEARPYALVQLLAVIHIALTLESAQRPTRRLRAGWVAVAAFLFYLHYTAALLIVAETVFFVLLNFKQPRHLSGPLCDLALVALLCLPAISSLLTIFSHRANWAAFVDRKPLWGALDWTPLPPWWWAVLVVVAGVGMRMEEKAGRSGRWTAALPFVLLVICWIAAPIGIAWLSTWTDTARLFFPRYLVVVLPAAALFAGLCAYAAPLSWQRFAIGLMTIGIAIWSSGIAHRRVRGEDWRGCVAWLNEELVQSQHPVLVWSGLIESDALRQPHDELLEEFCVFPVTSLYPLDTDPSDIFPLPTREPGQLDQVVEMLIVHRGGAWLVVRGDRNVAEQIATPITAKLQKSSVPEINTKWQIGEHRSFGRVQALLLKAADQP